VIRPASRADIRPVADVLAKAFYEDPPFVWMMPDDRTRHWRTRQLFDIVIRHEALRHGAVDVAWDGGAVAGAAIWFPPGTWPSATRNQLRTLPLYVRALGRRFGPASELVSSLAQVHPRTPNWYLWGIGVDPAHQGRGVGGALLRSRLTVVDKAGIPAYLESSKPANIPIYEHFGFQVQDLPALPAGAPVVTPMLRPVSDA
jgi:GNAT superfamily N-acetyltransferase